MQLLNCLDFQLLECSILKTTVVSMLGATPQTQSSRPANSRKSVNPTCWDRKIDGLGLSSVRVPWRTVQGGNALQRQQHSSHAPQKQWHRFDFALPQPSLTQGAHAAEFRPFTVTGHTIETQAHTASVQLRQHHSMSHICSTCALGDPSGPGLAALKPPPERQYRN